MKVTHRVRRSWVGLLLAAAGIFTICGCSDNTKSTLGVPVVVNSDLPAATAPSQDDRTYAVTPHELPTTDHDVVLKDVSLQLSTDAGFITSENEPTPCFMLSATDPNNNPLFNNVGIDLTKNNAGTINFTDVAILPPGNFTLSLGPNTLLVLDGYTNLQNTRTSGVPLPDSDQYPGLIVSKMEIRGSVNGTGATRSWTLPTSYNQCFMRTTDGKYTMNGSTFTLTWDNETSKAPTGGSVTITMDLFDGNATTPKMHLTKTAPIVNGKASFDSMSSVTFSRVEFIIDMCN